MMIIYQLKAMGTVRGFYDKKSIFSKKVFSTKKAAMEHEPAFRKLVTDDKEFITLGEPICISTHELELDASLIKINLVKRPGGGNGN